MTIDNDLVKRLRAVDHLSVEDCFTQSPLYGDAADRIEVLTEQLEAARRDAKEAEAYAEELEAKLSKMISTNEILIEQWDKCDSATFRQSMEMLRADIAEARKDKL